MNIIKPGMFQFFYCDVVREQFDKRNQKILQEKQRIDYVFIGDSITRALPTHQFSREKISINSGVNGDETQYMLKRFMADAIQLKPETIILLGGINDLQAWMRQESYLGLFEEAMITTIIENIESMVELAKEHDINIYVSSILPLKCMNVADKVHVEKANTLILSINKGIAKIAEHHHIGYLEYYSVFIDRETQQLDATLTEDGLHLNALGYEKMIRILQENVV